MRGAKMQPLTVVGGIGQRLVSAANLLLEISAGALVGCGFSLSNPREGRRCRPKGMRTGKFENSSSDYWGHVNGKQTYLPFPRKIFGVDKISLGNTG